MAKRGRKPKPTTLKILHGERADRINEGEPVLIDGDPTPPASLAGEGLAEWGRIVPMLRTMGVLSRVDAAAIAIYCFAYQHLIEAEAELAKSPTTTTAAGGLKLSPHFQIAKESAATIQRFLSEFGGSPSARSRLNVGNGREAADPLDAYQPRRTKA